jgi:DNA replication ATP-dependent helicase Dna2
LITGFTHSSINNALNRVKSLDENVAIAKFGRVALGDEMIDEGIQCLSSGSVSHKDFIAGEGWIAGATVFESSKNIYRSAGLDVVIIDESSQLNSALALCALSLAQKTIMIGDHMQLPPIIKAKYDKPYLDKSLFEYLIEKFGGTILSETYRMSNELSDFPSRMFYSSGLFASQRVIRSDESVSLFGSTTPIIWISYDQKRKTRVRARKEAILIRETIQELVRQNIPPSDIGIVSPFRAQIRYVLKEIGYETEIDVNTVEKFQGREKRIIILSLVSNDVKFLEEVKEFYFDVRRFNVAITRAKSKMIIVANSSFLDFDLDCSGYRIMREYLKTGLKVIV